MQNRHHIIPRIPARVDLNHLDPITLKLMHQPTKLFKEFPNGNSRLRKYFGKTKNKALGTTKKTIVSLCQDTASGSWFAFKAQTKDIIIKGDEKFSNARSIIRELNILHSLNQTIIQPTTNEPLKFQHFSTKKNEHRLYFPMQLAHGKALSSFLYHFNKQPQTKHPVIYFDMVLGMIDEVKKLHDKEWVHRDIKPGNFVYDELENKTRLIDMASLLSLYNGKKLLTRVKSRYYGTDSYTEPSIKKNKDTPNQSTYSKSTDIYSLAQSIAQVLKLKKHTHLIPDPKIRNEIQMFLDKMRIQSRNKRPTIQEVKDFFEQKFSEITQSLSKIKVGLLSISTYEYVAINFSPIEQKLFMEKLNTYDKIVLIEDRNMLEPSAYAKFIHRLENANISVVPNIFEAGDPNTIGQYIQETLPQQSSIFKNMTLEYVQATVILVNETASAAASTNTGTEFFPSSHSNAVSSDNAPPPVNNNANPLAYNPFQTQQNFIPANSSPPTQHAEALMFFENSNAFAQDFGLFSPAAKRRKLATSNDDNNKYIGDLMAFDSKGFD